MIAAARRTDERYEDWQPVGRGGSATVYKVFDRELGVQLAIKILKSEACADPRQLASLRREVLISRALRHPNICPIHDLYEGEHGIGVIMDLLEGQDLKQWIGGNKGALLDTLPQRLVALRQIAAALALAHQLIIHRDLKPANIFLPQGSLARPLIMDFGLSVLEASVEARLGGGTPKYMSPEQYLTPEAVDQRTDLFSFGVLAYELLTDGQIPASSLQHIRETRQVPDGVEIVPPSRYCEAIPPALDRVILQLLQTDREKRPRTAQEVIVGLAGVAIDTAVQARPAEAKALLDTVTVPAGTYVVGSKRVDAPAPEKPRRRVKLASYRIGCNPVTNREYAAFIAATGYRTPRLLGDAVFGAPELPVVGVTWEDASAYARWVGGRLPTETEWEVAARAGDHANEYPWGATPPVPSQANIDRVCDRTTPLGSYPAGRNGWGLFDMCGNVWEWCADGWDDQLHRRGGDDVENPVGQSDGGVRSLRGGSFDSFVGTGRCSFRGKAPVATVRADIGFRVVFDASVGGGHGQP